MACSGWGALLSWDTLLPSCALAGILTLTNLKTLIQQMREGGGGLNNFDAEGNLSRLGPSL